MLRRNLVAGAITALMVSPAFAFLDKVGLGGGNSGKAVDADSFNKSRTDLEKKYILAAAAVLASQIDLAQALNVKADIAQAEELKALAEEKGLLFMVTYTYTGHVTMKYARDLIRAGEIAESGSHQQLMDQKGAYYSLYTHQYRSEATQAMLH